MTFFMEICHVDFFDVAYENFGLEIVYICTISTSKLDLKVDKTMVRSKGIIAAELRRTMGKGST